MRQRLVSYNTRWYICVDGMSTNEMLSKRIKVQDVDDKRIRTKREIRRNARNISIDGKSFSINISRSSGAKKFCGREKVDISNITTLKNNTGNNYDIGNHYDMDVQIDDVPVVSIDNTDGFKANDLVILNNMVSNKFIDIGSLGVNDSLDASITKSYETNQDCCNEDFKDLIIDYPQNETEVNYKVLVDMSKLPISDMKILRSSYYVLKNQLLYNTSDDRKEYFDDEGLKKKDEILCEIFNDLDVFDNKKITREFGDFMRRIFITSIMEKCEYLTYMDAYNLYAHLRSYIEVDDLKYFYVEYCKSRYDY